MGYQALLFCPDEKTARSVTQVLGELEFNVDACAETFAAVKKLMGQHFDAIVVDCDNEQNATLLFKSARNSTSNQASLAVAVVEGQAGVAKAFRIGANLVLTKPINVEQAKGTLRVARGLLRKGEPAKAGSPATSVASPAKSAVSAPAASAAAKAVPTQARPVQAATTSSDSTPAPSLAAPNVVSKPTASVLPAAKAPIAVAPAASASDTHPGFKPATHSPAVSLSSGAASAPAPAKEILDIPPVEAAPASSTTEDDDILESSAIEHARESVTPTKDVPPPSFTLGGASAREESSGTRKKILLGFVAVALVAAGVFASWTYFGGHSSQPANSLTPVSKPSSSQPASSSSTPATSSPLPSSKPSAQPASAAAAPATTTAVEDNETAPEEEAADASPSSTKPANSASSSAGKAAAAAKTEAAPAAPLVVKGGSAPAKPAAAPETPAPSVIGIAAPGSSGPLPNIAGPNAPAPVLQRLNISQGVSQGLLIKKVAPVYPATALHLRIEGSVQMLATVSKEGDITEVKVLSGAPQLAQAAADAVKRWKYKPYLLNGEPVEIQTQITINFKMPR